MRRLGILGGTFDPPHVGHLVAGRNALHQLALDTVVFVVAGEPWQKVGERDVSPARARLALIEAAVAGLPWAEVSRVEVDRAGPSYTADTLAALAEDDPDAELVLLVGVDAARNMATWERLDEVLERCRVAMVDRPLTSGHGEGEDRDGAAGTRDDVPPWVDARVHIPLLDLSSTELRRRVRDGEPLDHLVPPGVVSAIADLGLYRETRL